MSPPDSSAAHFGRGCGASAHGRCGGGLALHPIVDDGYRSPDEDQEQERRRQTRSQWQKRHHDCTLHQIATRWGFQIGMRFVTGCIERVKGPCVKGTMELVRIAVCSLLPALWLVAAGFCWLDAASGCAGECCRPAVSAGDDRGRAPVPDARSFEQSARVLNRRMGTQIGWGGVPVPVAVSTSGFDDLEQVPAPLTVSTEALGLAKCWQFYWRTASEPRAPSSVS